MAEPSIRDIDALVGPATPHFAYQLRARVRELIEDLPADHPVRRYGEEKMRLLDALGHASSKAEGGEKESRERLGLGADPELCAGVRAAAAAVMSFAGASVFVTGGSRGIGKAIALRFAGLGATRVAIGYMRSDAAAEQTAEELEALGAKPILIRGNISSNRVLEEVAELGALDVLVHNAATGVIKPALETSDKHWDWTLTANTRALLALTRVVAPQMLPGASIIGISSLGAQRVLENYTLVGTSKAALEALIRYLAVELAPLGIRANAVSGGVVDTGALEHFSNREEMLRMGAANPAGRLVKPEDIAEAVTFLCSPEAEMIRGQTLIVDGGFSLRA